MYKAPSVAPIMKRKTERRRMEGAKAIPMKDKRMMGAISKLVFLRPTTSPKMAAMKAPTGAPTSGMMAHHEPASLVVGMGDVGAKSCGR